MRIRFALTALLMTGTALAADDAAPSAAPSSGGGSGDLYQTAKDLFDQYAPPDVKAQYDFPSKEQFNQFLQQLQEAMDGGSFGQLGAYLPQARQVLAILRTMPDQADTADWLAARIDEIDEAGRIAAESNAPPAPAPAPVIPPVTIPEVLAGPAPAAAPPAPAAAPGIPYYERWYARLSRRPPPANADALMPRLSRAFAAEGVPGELAWIAEVESSLNPSARSPAGARGLFQLKADTARGLGLSTFLPDERTDPEKSAHAAARDLRRLREKFGSWPLAIAAYNAGEGRVGRALASRHARDFAEIASSLPAGTRLYVPEVLALVAVRTGVTPDRLSGGA